MTKSKEGFFCPRKGWKLHTEDESTPLMVVEEGRLNKDGQNRG